MAEHNWIKVILTPFSWIYGAITSLRNFLYDSHFFQSHDAPQFTIAIGNITVGGTGKTPMVEYLTHFFLQKRKVAILSRGYGRKTKGLQFADTHSTAADVGDEPLQYFSKFGKNIVVAVCENRVNGALAISETFPERDLLLLDDAYQHRAIGRQINILLNDYNRPLYKDLPFPAGRLRETRRGAQRADLIVVTKCPTSLAEPERREIENNLRHYSKPDVPVFFSSVSYAQPISFETEAVLLKNVIIVAGIANPLPFLIYIRSKYNVMEEVIFPDHHNYTATDLEHLMKYIKNDTFVLTTEKDMVKLKPLVSGSALKDQFAYLPIAVDFGTDTERFNSWITQHTR